MTHDLTTIMNPQLGEDVLHASNLVKEGLQEIILQSLSETGFFDHALFHGGTCLRILHGLDRFSEDLDFTLREKNLDFDLEPYLDSIISKMRDYGLEATASARRPKGEMMVYSAKVKLNLHDVLETSGFDKEIVRSSHSKALVVVKIDVDLDPPAYSREIVVEKTSPLPYSVRTEPLPVLFAGKTSAVLCRHWGNRVKGRDMYDFRWYIEHGIPIDIRCLESRMDKKCNPTENIDRDDLVRMLTTRFENLDWTSAEEDVVNFIDREQLGDWGPEPFKELANRIEIEEE